MKAFFIVTFFLFSEFAHAGEIKVDITSFRYAGSRTAAAELCGKVTSDVFPVVVKVTVDPKTEKPGIYNTIVGPEATFCVAIITYREEADASAWLLK
jgi:hypothetical protein